MNNQAFMMGHRQIVWAHNGHLTLQAGIAVALSVIFLILLIKIIVGISILHHHRRNEMKVKDRTADYKAVGLSDNDIVIFRETLKEAKQNIEKWEAASKKYTDISVIEDVTGGLSAAKKTFQYIVKNPREATRQGDFLYKQLPNIVKLTETFDALKKESASSDKDEAETLLLMKTLSANIANGYHLLLMKDIEIIGKEIQNDQK